MSQIENNKEQNQNENMVVNLNILTCLKLKEGLFDYESGKQRNTKAIIGKSVVLSRNQNGLRSVNDKGHLNESDKILCNIDYFGKSDYTISNPIKFSDWVTQKSIDDLSNKIWFVTNQEPAANYNEKQRNIIIENSEYYLHDNDILKFGRIKFNVNKIHINQDNASSDNSIVTQDTVDDNNNNNNNNNIKNKNNKYADEINSINVNTNSIFDFIYKASTPETTCSDAILCKICYNDESTELNPWVSLCKCTGGIQYAHYDCIKQWMHTKLVISSNSKNTVTSYNIKAFNCEICKSPYPFKFQIGSDDTKVFHLIDIALPKEEFNYIILESWNYFKEANNIKSLHVIWFDEDERLTIGRGHETDIRVKDISVSRFHASLHFDKIKGKVFMNDLLSKFGSLVLLKRPVNIGTNKICLQVGYNYMEAKLDNIENWFEDILNHEKKKMKYNKLEPETNIEQWKENDHECFGEI